MKKNTLLTLACLSVTFALYITSCSSRQQKPGEEKTTGTEKPEDAALRGKYLVSILGCNDCHSPKKMGAHGPEVIPELMLSGFPSSRPIAKFDSKMIKDGFAMFYPDLTGAAGPWGVSFAANLTPDATGTGNWTEDQFKKAITKGIFKGLDGDRQILPPMPWQDFANLKDEDVHAIFEYLKSIKPVNNIVPPPVTPDKM
jgi:hypothetical protein